MKSLLRKLPVPDDVVRCDPHHPPSRRTRRSNDYHSMPWESSSSSVAAGSPSHHARNKRNVGILEVKMKQRLQFDTDAVAIGSIRHQHPHRQSPSKPGVSPSSTSSSRTQQQPQKKKARKAHTLPQLHPPHSHDTSTATRPHSFETERTQVMDALALPSPTRVLIQRHVDHAKQDHAARQDALPPIAGVFKRAAGPSLSSSFQSFFPQAYQRGELPIMVESRAGGQTLRWTKDLQTLEFGTVFPLFLDGMRERSFPFHFMAREGAFQLVQFGSQYPERVLACLPRVVPALRALLNLRDDAHMRDALLVIQGLARIHSVGQALVPYYRQLLPLLNRFKSKRRNLGDAMDFKQHSAQDVGELILETLELLETTGGGDAFVNIKYMVPTYEGVQLHK